MIWRGHGHERLLRACEREYCLRDEYPLSSYPWTDPDFRTTCILLTNGQV